MSTLGRIGMLIQFRDEWDQASHGWDMGNMNAQAV